MFTTKMQLEIEFDVRLLCNRVGMMQVQWTDSTKLVAQILGPKDGIFSIFNCYYILGCDQDHSYLVLNVMNL